MHAVSSSSFEMPFAHGLRLLAGRFLGLFAPQEADRLPAELRGLPDRILRDVGIDPRTLAPDYPGAVTPPDILHSPRAMATFLAMTVR